MLILYKTITLVYMTAIFLIIWTLVQLSQLKGQKLKRFVNFYTGVNLICIGNACSCCCQLYLDLKTHGETFTNIVNLKTEDSWYLDFFAKT